MVTIYHPPTLLSCNVADFMGSHAADYRIDCIMIKNHCTNSLCIITYFSELSQHTMKACGTHTSIVMPICKNPHTAHSSESEKKLLSNIVHHGG